MPRIKPDRRLLLMCALLCWASLLTAETGGRAKTAVWTVQAGEAKTPVKLISGRAFGSYESYRPTPLPPPMVHQFPFGPGVGPGWYGAGPYGSYWGGNGLFRPGFGGPGFGGPGWGGAYWGGGLGWGQPGWGLGGWGGSPWWPRGFYGYYPRYGWGSYYLGRVPLLNEQMPFADPVPEELPLIEP